MGIPKKSMGIPKKAQKFTHSLTHSLNSLIVIRSN